MWPTGSQPQNTALPAMAWRKLCARQPPKKSWVPRRNTSIVSVQQFTVFCSFIALDSDIRVFIQLCIVLRPVAQSPCIRLMTRPVWQNWDWFDRWPSPCWQAWQGPWLVLKVLFCILSVHNCLKLHYSLSVSAMYHNTPGMSCKLFMATLSPSHALLSSVTGEPVHTSCWIF